MNITLTPYEEQALESAIMHSISHWRLGIHEAQEGKRPAFSIDGALMIIRDLEEVQEKLKSNR